MSINTKVPQEVRIGFLVHDVSRMRRTLFDQAMKPLGITRSQWWVLSQLSRHARSGMLQTELARDLDVGKVTVGGLIDRLEAAGYVVRQPEKTDRRAKRIMITPRGHEILEAMVVVGRRLNGVILAGLDPEAIAAVEQALETMKENIRGAVAEKDEVELPVGVFAPDETLAVVEPTPPKVRAAGRR
jgi:MarR family transcriptional regulator for hemolysin